MALKREGYSSIFGGLEETTSEMKKEKPVVKVSEPEDKKDVSHMFSNTSVSTEEKEQKTKEKAAPIKEEKEKTKHISSAENLSVLSPDLFDFRETEEKDLKKIRKNFLFTSTTAGQLRELAKKNNLSENKLMEKLINVAYEASKH